ncbi:MAG: alpha/beta fold hydrolase [Aaplasma endosymbiont of Hyalomma asiaticum]
MIEDKITVISGGESFDMYYRVYNEELLHENAPLMCVHGIRGSCLDFDVLARSVTCISVIAIDVVGRGQSSWLKDGRQYNYNTYCYSCIQLLRHLEVEKCNFLGTSMGGIIGIFLASRFPNLIAKLILNDIGPYMSKKSLEGIVRYMLHVPVFDDLDAARKYLKVTLSSFGISQEEHWTLAFQSHITENKGQYVLSSDPKIGLALQNEVESIGYVMDLWDLWEKIPHDILVIKGEYSNVLTSGVLRDMAKRKPSLSAIIYKNVGHAPALYTPARIDPIMQWLAKPNS